MSIRKISIQIYSDLHLELTKSIPKITPKSPYLFLAGDITRFSHPSFGEFLTYCNDNWEKHFMSLEIMIIGIQIHIFKKLKGKSKNIYRIEN